MAVSSETKVGAFFLLALLVLGWFTFRVENLSVLFEEKKLLTASFDHASGLKSGDGVHVAGLRVGEIKELQLEDDSVLAVMEINADAKIRTSSRAVIAWGGLIGSRYIDISLGNPNDPEMTNGAQIETIPSIELDAVFRKVDSAAGSLGEMFQANDVGPNISTLVANLKTISEDIIQEKGTIGKLVGSPELYDKALAIADDLKATSSRLSKLIDNNDERITSIIKNMDETAPDMRASFANIKKLTQKAQNGKGVLAALISDEKMLSDLRGTLSQLNSSLAHVEALTESMHEGNGLIARLSTDEKLANEVAEAITSMKNLAVRLDKGDNTLARLTRDKDLYDDMKKVLDDARETLRTAKEQVPVGTFAAVILSAF